MSLSRVLAGRSPNQAAAGRSWQSVQRASKGVVQVLFWTLLVKLGLVIGGAQGAAIQYLVNR